MRWDVLDAYLDTVTRSSAVGADPGARTRAGTRAVAFHALAAAVAPGAVLGPAAHLAIGVHAVPVAASGAKA